MKISHVILEIDPSAFTQSFERACEAAYALYASDPSERGRNRAVEQLNGLFKGVLAVVQAAPGRSWESGLIDIAREISEKYAAMINKHHRQP